MGKSHQRKSYTYICQYCGKEYHPKERDRNKYCSRECAFTDKAKKPIEKKKPICIVCGKEFEGRTDRKYCSDECRKIHSCQKSMERSKKMKQLITKPRQCKECGNTFTPEYGNKNAIVKRATKQWSKANS